MVIFNNMAAMSALNETNRNTNKWQKTLKQAASGMRINSAGDDASGYSISEKMRVKIRALGQCRENAVKGQDMLDTASEAVDQQVNIMKQVKTIALRATDDTYTDKDRENLQKELSQLLNQSEDIANTSYNGIQLLNQKTITEKRRWFDGGVPYHVNPNGEPVLKQAANGDYTVPKGGYVDFPVGSVVYDPNTPVQGTAYTSFNDIADGDYVWDNNSNTSVQVFIDPNDGSYHLGSLTGPLIEIAGSSNPPGSANQVANSTNVSRVQLQAITVTAGPPAVPAVGDKVALNSVYPSSTSDQVTLTTNPYTKELTYFNTDGNGSYTRITELDLSALAGSIANVPAGLDGIGFSLDCGGCDQFVTIMFDAFASDTKLYESPTGTPPPMCYVVGVSQLNSAGFPNNLAEAIFNGINATTKGTKGSSLPSTVDTSTSITSKHDIKLNYYAATGKLSITKGDDLAITLKNGLMGEMKTDIHFKPEQGLYLQTSDRNSHNTRISMPNTTLSMLFPDGKILWDIDPTDADYPEEWPKGYENLSEAEKKEKWKQEVWPYPAETNNWDYSTCVSTREKANDFLDGVDQAIKYLLDANTGLGVQSSKLDFTQENLVVMQENTTSAESVQRDADMAKVMLENAKYSILQQSAQSMLAQANHQPQGVLSLLGQ